MSFDFQTLESRIVQIIPADTKYMAVFMEEDGSKTPCEVICWALREERVIYELDGKVEESVITEVVGMVMVQGFPHMVTVDDGEVPGFSHYQY